MFTVTAPQWKTIQFFIEENQLPILDTISNINASSKIILPIEERKDQINFFEKFFLTNFFACRHSRIIALRLAKYLVKLFEFRSKYTLDYFDFKSHEFVFETKVLQSLIPLHYHHFSYPSFFSYNHLTDTTQSTNPHGDHCLTMICDDKHIKITLYNMKSNCLDLIEDFNKNRLPDIKPLLFKKYPYFSFD